MMKGLILCLLLLCFLSQGEAKGGRGGGGRGGGRSSGSRSSYSSGSRSSSSRSRYSSTYYSGSGSDYEEEDGGGMATWIIFLIVFIVVAVFLCMCCGILIDSSDEHGVTTSSTGVPQMHYEGTTSCYMCLNRIKNSDWDTDHRKKCFYLHKEEILRYPTPYTIFCPKCGEVLRVWPKKGATFICDNMDSQDCVVQKLPNDVNGTVRGLAGGREIINAGINRFNCFICDYNLCKGCVLKETSGSSLGSKTFNRTNSIKYNKYNYDPNMAIVPKQTHWENAGGTWQKVESSASAIPSTEQGGLPYQVQPTAAVNPSSQGGLPYQVQPKDTVNPSSQGGLPYQVQPIAPATTQGSLPYSINPISPSGPDVNMEPSAPPSYFDGVNQHK